MLGAPIKLRVALGSSVCAACAFAAVTAAALLRALAPAARPGSLTRRTLRGLIPSGNPRRTAYILPRQQETDGPWSVDRGPNVAGCSTLCSGNVAP